MRECSFDNFTQERCRVAVLSDIHSNAQALRACLADAEQNGADGYLFLGDYVSGLAEPTETMDLVYETQRRYPTGCIRGNRERYVMEYQAGTSVFLPGSHTGTFLFTCRQLRQSDIDFLTALPIYDTVRICGIPMELAHARKNNDRVYYEDDERILRVFEEMETDFFLTGHSHKQFLCRREGKTVINPGSVGLPQGGDCRAQYALVDVAAGDVRCTFRQIPYDMEAMIRAQFQSGLAELGGCWAISDLYGALTGREYTKMLLEHFYRMPEGREAAFRDEGLWRKFAAELGLALTEEGILADWKRHDAST